MKPEPPKDCAELLCFKTLWGFPQPADSAIPVALDQGFDGVEGPAPGDPAQHRRFAAALRESGLHYIAEVATAGAYVPDRRWSVAQQLEDLRSQLQMLDGLQPLFVTCLGGCDAWSLDDSLLFFEQAQGLAAERNLPICFETHRGRSLFNPWLSREILQRLPQLRLTLDFSHWCVVCEGLQQGEEALIRDLAPKVQHIHARVGYDQGPQVADPRLGCYRQQLERHLALWEAVWGARSEPGAVFTATPEFGPDGYQYRSPDGARSLVDLDELNLFMAETLRARFALRSDRPACAAKRA